MSKRRLIRHSPGVLMTLLLLLATLVPAANAQLVTAPPGVQGVAVDANTREPIAEVINVVTLPGNVCPGGVVPLNPGSSLVGLPAEAAAAVGAIIPGAPGVNPLNCTSVSSL